MKRRAPKIEGTHYEQLPDWLTPMEARIFLRVSRSKMYELLKTGEVPFRRFGRLCRVSKRALGDAGGGSRNPIRHER